jgi:integrase
MKALLTLASPDELQILEKPQICLNGVNFDEDFLSALVAKHFNKQRWQVRLAALIQLNTGMRISEHVLARLDDDLVLDHDIPHLWVRKNRLTDRKMQASIRCVPLLGVSLQAAKE